MNTDADMDQQDPHHLDKIENILDQEEKRYIDSCLKVIELMVIQMENILHEHPEAMSVSFSLEDGDEDSIPIFYCPDKEDNDLGENPEIEAISEQWNSLHHAGVRHFILYACDFTISRDSLVNDRRKLIDHISQSLPVGKSKSKQWSQNLDSFLKRRDLLCVAQNNYTSSMTPDRGKKPGM